MVATLPELLKHAVVINREDPDPAKPHVKEFHWMAAPLTLGDWQYVVRLGIQHLYDT